MEEEKQDMSDIIDLHVHSNASDGTFTPSEIVGYVVKNGWRAVALRDPDPTDGF